MNAGTYILSLRPNGITFQENLHHSCFKSNVFFFSQWPTKTYQSE
jgi:hypothetical protein